MRPAHEPSKAKAPSLACKQQVAQLSQHKMHDIVAVTLLTMAQMTSVKAAVGRIAKAAARYVHQEMQSVAPSGLRGTVSSQTKPAGASSSLRSASFTCTSQDRLDRYTYASSLPFGRQAVMGQTCLAACQLVCLIYKTPRAGFMQGRDALHKLDEQRIVKVSTAVEGQDARTLKGRLRRMRRHFLRWAPSPDTWRAHSSVPLDAPAFDFLPLGPVPPPSPSCSTWLCSFSTAASASFTCEMHIRGFDYLSL